MAPPPLPSRNPFAKFSQEAPALPARGSAAQGPATDITPLRAHYLKRQLVTLEFAREFAQLQAAQSVAVLGKPFLPDACFADGKVVAPDAPPAPTENADIPFIKHIFHHFILTFPFLKNTSPTFFSHKLQPLIYSFMQRNISSGDDDSFDEDWEDENARIRLKARFEKQMGLVLSAAIKVSENGGREEVVRLDASGGLTTGVPATLMSGDESHPYPGGIAGDSRAAATAPSLPPGSASATAPSLPPRSAAVAATPAPDDTFDINVVSVRVVTDRGYVRNSSHEEFIVRTRQTGSADVYVARRYTQFNALYDALRKECINEEVARPPAKDKRATTAAGGDDYDAAEPVADPVSAEFDFTPAAAGTLPPLSRERNRLTLRAWLRALLDNDALAASTAFRRFLLDAPIVLTAAEVKDVELRERMDRLREAEAARFATEVESRVTELEQYLRAFKEDLVRRDGLTRVFGTIRTTPDIAHLPVEYQKVLEWARISLASTIYRLFLGADNASQTLANLKTIHGMMPYFVLKGILKISNPVTMIRNFLDLFLARPFGSSSLLQRMFSTGLADEARELNQMAALVSDKVGDPRMVQKVQAFVAAPRDVQEAMKRDAASEKNDIITVILRSPDEPRLDAPTLQRVQRCAAAHAAYKQKRNALADPDDDEGPDNDDAWLYEDLHVLLRVLKRARDKEQLTELIFEGYTSEVIKDVVTIFYEPLAKVYKAANIADSISDLQAFINDLIHTVEAAEDANLSEPQKTVQMFIDLVARHEGRFYNFVHQVHAKGEGLFDSLMEWIELFINFVRDGIPQRVSLEALLPAGGVPRAQVISEIDAIIAYHYRMKLAHRMRLERRYARGEVDATEENAFLADMFSQLKIDNMMADADDVAAEDSDGESDSASIAARKGVLQPPPIVHIKELLPLFTEMIRPALE